MKRTASKSKEIATKFALASKNSDIVLLKRLLSKDGSFHIQDPSLETIEVSRDEFLRWYKEKLDTVTIESIDYDQCLHCYLGKPVVLFNNGKFPRQVQDSSERTKTGLALNISGNKILEIAFCYTFLNMENKYVYQATGDRIKKYIEDGLKQKKAIAKGIADQSKEFNLE
jgi:hypothetical protein